MNKRGQILFVVATAVMIFMFGMIIMNFIKDDVVTARSSNNLDCTNTTSISDGTKVTCLFADLTVPYLFIGVVTLAGGIIAAKFALQ